MAMLDPMMAEFQAEMRAKARVRPRRESTKRNAEIEPSSPAGAAELGRRICAFWTAVGYDIQVEIIPTPLDRASRRFGASGPT
jgi:hypothetical protein